MAKTDLKKRDKDIKVDLTTELGLWIPPKKGCPFTIGTPFKFVNRCLISF